MRYFKSCLKLCLKDKLEKLHVVKFFIIFYLNGLSAYTIVHESFISIFAAANVPYTGQRAATCF